MPERREEKNGLLFWLLAGDYAYICISFDNSVLTEDTINKCCFQVRISKLIFDMLKNYDKDHFIEYISNRFCYHFGFLLNHLTNEK